MNSPRHGWPISARAARDHAVALGHCLRPLAGFALAALLVLTGSRLLLAWSYADRIGSPAALLDVLGRGWRFDVVVVSAACAVALLLLALAPGALLRSLPGRLALTTWFAAWLMLIIWNEAATPDFIAEFGVRPNHLYVEYLCAPREIAATIWKAHQPALLTGLVLVALAGWLAARLLHARRTQAPPLALRVVALAPLLALALLGARGSTGHRPLNISFAATGTDPLVNDLALNSTYSALHALRAVLRERGILESYGDLPREEVVERVRAMMQLPDSAFTDPRQPTLHQQVPTGAPGSGRRNLVILLQESLGAHYVASLGGQPVARMIDSWRGRSFWFDQLYASGTRSARGLEAVVTGFLPTRASSVLKLEGAQQHFFTLAAALRAQGYRTEFIYGGDSSFDNMRGFFLANGFDRVIDRSDMRDARFATTWGVSDEDLYGRVEREVDAHHRDGRPFFTLVFSTSNHPPYEYPDGRIDPYERPKNTPGNAARYADFAVGSYLQAASRSAAWADTLFMVVADHESKVIGEGLVPVMSFHIPAFIAGGPVEPRIISRVASQTDLLPTALSLMGVAARIPATGVDQTRDDLVGPGWAMMQFHDTAAYRTGNDVVILAPGSRPRHFTLRGETLAPAPPDRERERYALALTQWPVMAYAGGLYR